MGALRLFALFIFAVWLGSGPAMAEKRVALVIGNSAYKSVPKLSNPVNDAALVGGMFRKAGFDTVDVKLDLSVVDMRKALREFGAKAREADVAVIYYAGHGIELDGNNYLIPTDAALETDTDVLDEAFPLDRVLFAIEPAKQLRLVILDACRDNPFAKTMKRTVASRAIGRGLAKVEPTSPNTMIAFAAKAGSTASDGDAKNSPFATALVDRLPTPGLDLRKAFGFVRDDVLKNTGYKQEPYVYGSLGGDDVSLVPAKPAAAPGPQANPQDSVRRDYELALQAGDREAWQAFLQAYPDGFYANLARVQLKKILAFASVDTLDALKAKQGRVCPLICDHGFKADGDSCVKITCRAGYRVNDDNECEKVQDKKPVATREEGKNRDTERKQIEAAPAKPSASGQTFCSAAGCRPVRPGCRLERGAPGFTGPGGTTQAEVCN
ncbi:caspase family protein [Bradyrhizobium sp. CCGUVB1N3]|uniref:caspase family protein n=1 Tax=Bradyrhizobium sp. CCGUVB1N3 TaxID=2949629 RepID=UPI0020B4363E|nr:caspase family protein [Bradyrhizobium sp. CCGUVB1N3]MCP3477152.1 caspase family protein [Bradyrhizobium sp. CCGUVB1N3]